VPSGTKESGDGLLGRGADGPQVAMQERLKPVSCICGQWGEPVQQREHPVNVAQSLAVEFVEAAAFAGCSCSLTRVVTMSGSGSTMGTELAEERGTWFCVPPARGCRL
jgi:hypothetical protein